MDTVEKKVIDESLRGFGNDQAKIDYLFFNRIHNHSPLYSKILIAPRAVASSDSESPISIAEIDRRFFSSNTMLFLIFL